MKFQDFEQVEAEILRQLPRDLGKKFPGEEGIARAKNLLKLVGNPESKYKVIHVAGTSGKGSTAVMIAKLLESHGYKVGLHTSPHIMDVRDRVMINGEAIEKSEYVEYFNEFWEIVQEMGKMPLGMPTYFELLVGLAYWIFAKEQVDYAVVETGMGGKYDATNACRSEDKLSVITRIGLDHEHILGKTEREIAGEKAGIIVEGGSVVTIKQIEEAREVIEEEVKRRRGSISVVDNYEVKSVSEEGVKFGFEFEGLRYENLHLGMKAEYQVENASLALAGVKLVAERDGWKLDEGKVREALLEARYRGRFEVVKWPFDSAISNSGNSSTQAKEGGATLVLDGAHNPQKMEAFLNSLVRLYPGRKFRMVLGFKRGKQVGQMLEILKPHMKSVVVTQFFVGTASARLAMETGEVVQELKNAGYQGQVEEIADPSEVLERVGKHDEVVVCTGSLYLMSDLIRLMENK